MATLLSSLTPTNYLQERERFLRNPDNNPQFIYQNTLPSTELSHYGKPEKKYLDLAHHILDKAYFHRSESDLQKLLGPLVPQHEVQEKIEQFLAMHSLEKRFRIIYSASYTSRTAITPTEIRVRLPLGYREQDLIGMIYHEIGTHALRRINYEQQPWFKHKKKYGFSEYLKTEEGLASLHALIPRDMRLAYFPALRYLAAHTALNGSFVDVWNFLTPYLDSPERRWGVAFRQKRGVTDTSKPDAFTKDIVYFEGMVETWQWLSKHEFDITPLYFGKLSIHDVTKAQQANPTFQPLLPSFFTTQKEEYQTILAKIGTENDLHAVS